MTSQLDATGGELDEAIKKPLNTNNNPNAIGTATTSSSSTTATNMQPSDLNNQVEVNKQDTSHKSLIETKDAMSARIIKRSMSTHDSPPMHSRCSMRFSSQTPLTDETNKMKNDEKETCTDTSFKVIYARLKQTGVERDLFIRSSGIPRTRTNGNPAPKVAEIEHVPVVKDKTVAKEEAVVKGKEGLANPSSVMPQTPTLAVTGKRVSKPKVPKGASPPSEGWTSTMAVKGNSRADAANYTNSSSCSSPIGNSNIRRRRSHAKAAPKKSKPCASCTASVHPSGPKLCKKCIYEKGFAKKRWLDKAAGNYRHRDDDDYDSDISMVEVTVEDEISVPQAEKKQLENVVQQTATKEQEVVVIGGRKAVAIKADPIGFNMKVIPKQINLTGLKTISKDNVSSNLVQSLTDSHVGCQIVMAVMKIMTMKERVNMAQVCKTWSMISQDRSVWRTVTLRHTHISNWPCFIRELAKNGTRELDMLGTILPSQDILANLDLSVLKSLRVLRTCPVDDQFIYAIFRNLPQLLELRAICCSPNL
ncbi:GM13059 [Drosophila sechellia]|uniref:GM13059 n=1 Tax=Drosophila sechellia TaxID=7238 RepID=B4IK40_DROSE|nr:GM13059 [Drosophila sechellia]